MKHTGKTILTLLLAILMTVGLAGCGSSRSGSGGSLFRQIAGARFGAGGGYPYGGQRHRI